MICLLKACVEVGIIYRYGKNPLGGNKNGMKFNLFQNSNQGVLCSVAALTVIGSINIFSASYVSAQLEFGSSMMFFLKQLGAAILGTIVMFMAARFDYRKTRKWGIILGGIAVALLVLTALFGLTEGGARRWIRIGIIFQPSELAKIASVFLAAAYLHTQLSLGKQVNFWNREFGIVVVMGGLVYKQPDMGTAAIIVAIAIAMYFVGGLPTKQMKGVLLLVFGAACYLATTASYRMARIMSWLDPWQYAAAEGYQAVQAQMTIGAGGLTGMGWGSGMSKFYYLPEAHTDFAFAMFCQEWGLIGTLVFIIIPFAIFTQQGIRIAVQTENYYGKMLAFGLTLLISGQAISNMMMVMGILPVIGVPLPFVSYGGTSLVINMACVGVLLNIGRQNKKRIARKANEEAVGLKLVSPESTDR